MSMQWEKKLDFRTHADTNTAGLRQVVFSKQKLVHKADGWGKLGAQSGRKLS